MTATYKLYYLNGIIGATIAATIGDLPEGAYYISTLEMDLLDLTIVIEMMQLAMDTQLMALKDRADQIARQEEYDTKYAIDKIKRNHDKGFN